MRHPDLAVPAAIALTVAAPIFVGVLVTSAPAPPPAPATGSLTVRHTQSPWWPRPDSELRLLVLSKGPPPTAATLRSASGATTVDVAVQQGPGTCRSPALNSGAGTDSWCLTLTGVPAGAEVSGTVKGTEASVALTVSSRPAFLLAPMLAALGGFVLAVLLSFLASPLQNVVRTAKLRRLASDNAQAGGDKAIAGLREWIDTRLSRGALVDDLAAQVGSLVVGAPVAARGARGELADAASRAEEPLGATHRLLAAAMQEIERTTMKVADFLDDDGEPVVHPASALTHLVNETVAAAGELDAIDDRIQTGLRSQCQPGPLLQVAWARRVRDAVADEAGLARFREALGDAREALGAMLTRTACIAPGAQAGPAAAAPERVPVPPLPQRLKPAAGAPVRLAGPVLVTAVVVVALLGMAMAAVAAGTYHPKPAFGTGWDYLATVLAGFGSGSAATVAATLSYWRFTGN